MGAGNAPRRVLCRPKPVKPINDCVRGVGSEGEEWGPSARLKKKSHSVAVARRGLSGVVDLGGLLGGRWGLSSG